MRRFLLRFLPLAIALLAILAGTAWYLMNDTSFVKSRLSAYMLSTTGRDLSVEGTLSLQWGRQLVVDATDIRLRNADWADEPYMVQAGRLHLVLDLPSLLDDTVIIQNLAIEDCTIDLIETETGTANWDDLVALGNGAEEQQKSPPGDALPIVFRDNRIENCRLTHAAPSRTRPLSLEIHELDLELVDDVRWQGDGSGRLNEDELAVSGWVEPAGVFINGGAFRHDLDITVGQVSLESEGTLQDLYAGQGADFRLQFQGPEIIEVLSFFGLPAASTGPFDFRLLLDTQGEMTELDIDGDLGSLQATLHGEIDRLVHPTRGQVSGKLVGPDLALLGSALGIDGLAATPYALDTDVAFEPGLVRFRLFELAMPADRLTVQGVLGTAERLAGSDLDISAQSEELGRWAGAFGQPVSDIGAVTLTGRLLSNADGHGTIRARVEHAGSTLSVDGALGLLGAPLHPDLTVDLHSSDPRALAGLLGDYELPQAPLDMRGQIAKPGDLLELKGLDLSLGGHRLRLDGRVNTVAPFSGTEIDLDLRSPNAAELGALFDREGLPLAPFTLAGRVSRPGQRIRFEGVVLDLEGHRVSVDGFLNPAEKYAGSEFEVQLDTPDVAALALLFGKEGLPHDPMKLSAVLLPEGKGLQFKTQQGSLGDIRLTIDGRIPNLEQPLALDAQFDIGLPSLTLLAFLAPEANLPDLPFTAVGQLDNQQDSTQLRDVRLTLGDIAIAIAGEIHPDQRFDLSIEAGGPDATTLQEWVGQPLAPEPFSLRTHAVGDPSAFELADLDVQLGKSQVNGDLAIGLGESKTVSGKLVSPFLDLSHWRTGVEAESPSEEKRSSPFVFDDTKVMWVEDYGVEADVTLNVAKLDLGNTQLRDLEFGVLLTPNRLEFAPVSLRGEHGSALRGRALLDDSGAKPVLEVTLNAQDLRMALSAVPGQDPNTIPPVELHVSLHGAGFTRREMASSLDGSIRAFTGPGLIASAGINMLFSDFLSELFDALNPLDETQDYTRLECSVWAADIVSGQVTVDPVIAQLEQFTILSEGNIDLQTEKLDLSFNTKPRKGLGITAGTVINTVIKVGGTLKTPAIEIDPAGVIVGGTAAVATAGLSIVAKSFSDRFLSSKDPCGDARKELAKRDGA